MKTRIIAAVVLLPIFLVILLLCPAWATAALVAGMAAVAAYELLYTCGFVKKVRIVAYTAVVAALVVVWSYFGCPKLWGMGLGFVYLLALCCELLAANTELEFKNVCVAVVSAFLIPFAMAALVRIRCMELGKYYLVASLILAFTSDSGAYFVGCFFGKHKLAPVISPKKTVEGLVGGAVSCILFMLIYGLVLQNAFHLSVNYYFCALYGLMGTFASVAGDLVFSVIKRQTGIKDYGNLMPGHGGVLDRFDSTVIVAPMTEFLVLFLPLAL